jgi:hypothetical protein
LGKYESRTLLAGEKPQVNARLTGPKIGFKPRLIVYRPVDVIQSRLAQIGGRY